jgi:hypothetical protein
VCSDVPAGLSRSLPLALHALRIALNFSPQKVVAAAGQPAACATAKGARADVYRAVLHAVAAAATPPPILLLGRACLVECPNWHVLLKFFSCPNPLLCYQFFCVTNYSHLVYGMQMASAARAWMYR